MIAGLIGCSVAVPLTEDVRGLLSVRSTESYPKRPFLSSSLSPLHAPNRLANPYDQTENGESRC